jgi:hypothetical protein
MDNKPLLKPFAGAMSHRWRSSGEYKKSTNTWGVIKACGNVASPNLI